MLHQRGQLGEDPRCSVADVRGQYQWWVMSETYVLLRYWSSWGGWACKIGDGHRSGAYVRNNILLILTWLSLTALFNISPLSVKIIPFFSLFLMVTWQREIDQARIERKITPWVIVIDNFPPLGLEGHNFGGYRRFIATPPQVTLTLPFHDPIFLSRPNMSITHPPITANSYDSRKHDLVRS